MLSFLKRREPEVIKPPLNAYHPDHQRDFITADYPAWVDDQSFMDVFGIAQFNTAVDVIRLHDLWNCVLQSAKLPEGDYLEIGVWRGGSGAVIATAANKIAPNAKVFLADTFEGIVKAGEHDNFYKGGEFADTSVETVQTLLDTLGAQNVTILKGIFPDVNAEKVSDKLRIVHIDVDVYQGAKEIVEWAAPRLVPGGLFIFDDYGFTSCRGVIKLVHELKDDPRFFYFYNANGHAVLIKR